MTTSTPPPSLAPTGCLYLVLMIVALLFVFSQPQPPVAGDDDEH